MKPLKNKKIKNLIIILAITVILSGMLPNYTYAVTDTENGGGLLKPIEQFVVFLCDNVMQWLQNAFTSTESIEQENGEYKYKFQYSPAIIFSGDVPALDINFIDPDRKEGYDGIENWLKKHRKEFTSQAEIVEWEEYVRLIDAVKSNCTGIDETISEFSYCSIYYKIEDNYLYVYVFVYLASDGDLEEPDVISYYETKNELTDQFIKETELAKYGSTALKLQGTIATWYNALRRIALVGLLSVLVYVGIRIVLTSSSQEKAKYKGMLKDWLVAICLLFTLHYIMNVTLVVVNEISDIFSTGETDTLLNSLRTDIYKGSWGTVLAQVIMYTTIVIFTITFTIQYMIRVIYMAFYTLIAPLITLTYPLDKIKDGQAQAFSMWIKEYIFTALTQVIHLVIYFVLVSSAMTLVDAYPLFAIIAMMFIKKAEGIIKKMFGFEKSETVSTLGAAATGGLIMNAISSIKAPSKGGKTGGGSGSGGGSSNSNVRTATNNPLVGISGTGSAPGGGTVLAEGSKEEKEKSKFMKKMGEIKNKPEIKGAMAVGGKFVKTAAKGVIGAGLGVTGGMIGLAAGISQGDAGAAFKGALAGGVAGKALGKRAVDLPGDISGGIKNGWSNIKNTYREGAYGAEAAQAIRFDEEFRKGSTYKALKDNENFSEESLQAMLDSGITDKKAMTAILDSGEDIEVAIGGYQAAKNCPDVIYYSTEDFETYCEHLKAMPGAFNGMDTKDIARILKKFK